MNELLKNVRQNSSKEKSKIDINVPRSPYNPNRTTPKKSLTINSVLATPKLHSNNSNSQSKQPYNTNAADSKIRTTPKGQKVLLTTEKKTEIKPKMVSSGSNNNMLAKKSQSQTKETKPPISNQVLFKESVSKGKPTALHLTEEEKSYLSNLDCMKTPKKIVTNTNNFMSSFTTPKNNHSNAVTNRNAFSPDADHNKVLNLLSPNNNIAISVHNLKLYNSQNYQTSKYSNKSLAYVKAYSANTNQGIIR